MYIYDKHLVYTPLLNRSLHWSNAVQIIQSLEFKAKMNQNMMYSYHAISVFGEDPLWPSKVVTEDLTK